VRGVGGALDQNGKSGLSTTVGMRAHQMISEGKVDGEPFAKSS